MKTLLACLIVVLSAVIGAAADMEALEKLIADGKPAEALPLLGKELIRRPNNTRLLYNFGVASYAAGKYEDALLAFDKVEAFGRPALVEKARAQKGNAEFHLGLNARADNLDETVEHWKTSLDHFRGALKTDPRDTMARNNHDKVQKLLMDILVKDAQQKLATALKNNW